MASATTTALPNLFVIGAAKAGTTALHNYLADHPEICMSNPKEPGIFARADWKDDLAAYERMFSVDDAPVRGESTTAYTRSPLIQGIPGRVGSTCPEARLIYMVRDPIDRLVALYVQRYSRLWEHRTLAAALKDRDQMANPYMAESRYATQLELWLEHFPSERILVLDQEDLRRNREGALRRIFEFLGVEARVPANVDREFNVTRVKERLTPAGARMSFFLQPVTRRLPEGAREAVLRSRLIRAEKIGTPALGDDLRALLKDELAEEAARFRALTGMAFEDWSV